MPFQEYVALAYPYIDWIAVGYALVAAAMPVLAVYGLAQRSKGPQRIEKG